MLASIIVSYAQPTKQQDSTVVQGDIVFPVNKYSIPSNCSFLQKLQNSVLPEMEQKNMHLTHICISGTASPEGTRQHNEELSKKRGEALLDTIGKLVKMPEDKNAIELNFVIEDYNGLLETMKEKKDSHLQEVLQIIDNNKDNEETLKTQLRTYNRGNLWRYLFRTYFSDLRKAKIKMIFESCKPPTPQEPTPYYIIKEEPKADTIQTINEPISRIHLLSLKSNLLYDIFYMPQFGWAPVLNIHAEYYPLNGHYTYSAGFQSGYYHRWSKHEFFQIRDYKLEARRYFKPATNNNAEYLGPFISAYIHADKFGFGFNAEKGWKGEGGGAGASFGYVKNISKNKRWRLEGFLALGFFICRYDPYVYGNPVTGQEDGSYYYDYTGNVKDFKKRNHMFRYFIPQVGINITYDLLYRKTKANGKKGVSLHRIEQAISSK